jgi:hypothetical protein
VEESNPHFPSSPLSLFAVLSHNFSGAQRHFVVVVGFLAENTFDR